MAQRSPRSPHSPSASINQSQRDLLALLESTGRDGCVVYGRAYSATIEALSARGLAMRIGAVQVASMARIELRPRWTITPAGRAVLLQSLRDAGADLSAGAEGGAS